MRTSFVFAVAILGFFLATSHNHSQAQGLPPANPTPRGELPRSEEPDSTGRRPGLVNLPKYVPPVPDPFTTTPKITRVGMVNGRVRFTFGASGSDTLKYNIRWSRGKSGGGLFDQPSRAEVDMRWTGAHDANGTRLEDYIINEIALPDTIYTFRVQAIRKRYTATARDPREETAFVSKSFLTPPLPSIADKIKVADKYGAIIAESGKATTQRSPFDLRLVDTTVRLKPGPIIGR